MKHPEFPILMIDDEEDILASYRMVLQQFGLNNLLPCPDGDQALTLLEKNTISVVLLDLLMPGVSGTILLKEIQEKYPHIPVIVITSKNDVSTAVECMKMGAYDFIVKPVDNLRLSSCVKRALDLFYLESEVKQLKGKVFSQKPNHEQMFEKIITSDPGMIAIFKYVEAIADSLRPVLITGESGVGKNLIADVIHRLSKRKGDYISINVGGLDDTAFSDSLLGHKKGAFTGAHSNRMGLVLKAENGTLFLDEIGELENSSQVKLLQLLQNNEYYPLGSDILKKASVKIIAATNQDLERIIKKGKFRNDLYYRLNIHRIHIPPLRERKNDIPLLVNHFMNKASKELNRTGPEITRRMLSRLKSYDYPGNIRELESILYNAVSLSPIGEFEKGILKAISDDKIDFDNTSLNDNDIPESRAPAISYKGEIPTLQEAEDFLIREAMRKTGHNQTMASQILGISQSTLSRRFSKNNKGKE
jgi:DNA-binding NtrC family response regulator